MKIQSVKHKKDNKFATLIGKLLCIGRHFKESEDNLQNGRRYSQHMQLIKLSTSIHKDTYKSIRKNPTEKWAKDMKSMHSHFTEKEAYNGNNYIKKCSTSGNKITCCRFIVGGRERKGKRGGGREGEEGWI